MDASRNIDLHIYQATGCRQGCYTRIEDTQHPNLHMLFSSQGRLRSMARQLSNEDRSQYEELKSQENDSQRCMRKMRTLVCCRVTSCWDYALNVLLFSLTWEQMVSKWYVCVV
jgi:hypothetical protein